MTSVSPFPLPQLDAVNRPYWEALAAGKLTFQRCDACNHAWLPPRSECPGCLSDRTHWEEASGRGRLVSWVVYHKAFNPAFADRLPYNVAVVALDEGPRLISNLIGCDDESALRIDEPLHFEPRDEHGTTIPVFRRENT